MNKIYFEVEGGVVIKYTPVPGIDNTYKSEVVMTKDAFQKCYKKWIKQESQESKTGPQPCEDAISRKAVLSYIYNDLGLGDEENGADIERQKELESSYKYVKSLPPVKPPTGHWIIMGDGYIKCSECKHITKTESPDIYHFCMVCGKKMSEEPTYPESEG